MHPTNPSQRTKMGHLALKINVSGAVIVIIRRIIWRAGRVVKD